MGPGPDHHVGAAEARHFGDAEARLHGKQEQRVVAAAEPGAAIRRREHGVDLGPCEEADQRPGMALRRNGEHPLDLRSMRRLFVGRVVEEGVNRRQPEIAGAGRVAAPLFQVIEEGGDQGRIELREREAGGGQMEVHLREAQQQAEGVPVGVEGVGAHLPLLEEPLREEALEKAGEERAWRHHADTSHRASRRCRAWPKRAG